jgi:hypothetical protein
MKTEMIFRVTAAKGFCCWDSFAQAPPWRTGKKSHGFRPTVRNARRHGKLRGGDIRQKCRISACQYTRHPVVMNEKSCSKFGPKVKSGGIILQNASLIKQKSEFPGITCHEIPATDLAAELGDARAANIVMLGLSLRFLRLNIDTVTRIAEEFFSQNIRTSLKLRG